MIDNGFITLGNFSFANWYYLEHGEKEGSINIERAISRSNDIFFYKLAELIGVERLSEMSRKFGLGQKLGIDIPGEASGVVPDDAWKKKNYWRAVVPRRYLSLWYWTGVLAYYSIAGKFIYSGNCK